VRGEGAVTDPRNSGETSARRQVTGGTYQRGARGEGEGGRGGEWVYYKRPRFRSFRNTVKRLHRVVKNNLRP